MRLVSIQRLWVILIHDGRRAPPSIVAIRPWRLFRLGGLDIGFDEGPPGPIGRGLLVDHAELLPPSSECHRRLPGLAALGSIERRPSETLPGLACLAHPWPRAGRAWRRHAFTAFVPTSRCEGLTARHSGEEKKCSGNPGTAGAAADQLASHSCCGWCGDGSRELDSLRWCDGSRLACG